jgi:hypothetical protein
VDYFPVVKAKKLKSEMQEKKQPKNIHPEGERLLQSIKEKLPDLKTLVKPSIYSPGEDSFYRFYHQSFKVFGMQKQTKEIVTAFKQIGEKCGAPQLNTMFMEIINAGTAKEFTMDDNLHWSQSTRPILEAYFHAREMLNLMIKYGETLDYAPNSIPSGWGAVLYLYRMR